MTSSNPGKSSLLRDPQDEACDRIINFPDNTGRRISNIALLKKTPQSAPGCSRSTKCLIRKPSLGECREFRKLSSRRRDELKFTNRFLQNIPHPSIRSSHSAFFHLPQLPRFTTPSKKTAKLVPSRNNNAKTWNDGTSADIIKSTGRRYG